MSSYNLIGLMSGTSMDGLDIVQVQFNFEENDGWYFKLENSFTAKYNDQLLSKLKISKQLSAIELLILDKELGFFFSTEVNKFIKVNNIDKTKIDAIASHGHTIFHQPEKGFTHQIGCGETIAYQTGLKVINDFRQKDVVAGGQGAPLVPIGDKLLFSTKADAFLNIGGFTNICYPGQKTKAYDICPGNLPLNYFAEKLGFTFDFNGELAREGVINHSILEELNSIKFYKDPGPKSLGTEWLENDFMFKLKQDLDNKDALKTIVEHIAIQINSDLNKNKINSVYITGGGARNNFLIERIKYHFKGKIIIPAEDIIDYKEALIFGFLGALFLNNQPNSLASVTGAKKDTIGGVLHIPN